MTAMPVAPAAGRASALARPLVFGALGSMLATLFILTLAIGSVPIPPADVVGVLFGARTVDESWVTIIQQVRLPRAVTALLAGAGLGVGGLQMQTLFRNPLADPFILGISSGASLGVAFVVLLVGTAGTSLVDGLGVLGNAGVAGAAAAGAAAVTVLVLMVSRRVASPATVLIIGLMAGYATSAIVSVLLYSGLGRVERIRAYISWGFGSFSGTTWGELRVLVLAVVIGLAIAAATTKPMNALLLGDRYAASMGLHVARSRLLIVVGASILAGTITAFCGPIAFIGVAAPHMTRGLLRTSDHRLLVPGVILLGSTIALLAGLVAQLPGTDATLPLNAVTSLIGAPVVVLILLRMRRSSRAVMS